MNKLSVVEPDKINAKHERLLAMLKNRYGYTNQKSIDELERLFKQFSRTNKSLGIHSPRKKLLEIL